MVVMLIELPGMVIDLISKIDDAATSAANWLTENAEGVVQFFAALIHDEEFRASLTAKLSDALAEGAKGIGASLAKAELDFLLQTPYDQGKAIGTLIGYIIPEIIIAVFSEGIGNAVKGAVKAVQIIVEAIKLTRVGKLIGTALVTVRKMFKVLESLFDGLKKMGRKGYEKIEEMFRKFLNGLKKFFGITDDLPVAVADDVPVTAGSDDLARQVGDEGGAVRTDNTNRKAKMDEASRKGDEIEAERPDYVTETDPMTELDARKRGKQDLDKNDPDFEDKLEAYVQAVIITTAADKIDEPVSALLVTLNSIIGSRFKVNFKSLYVGPSTFDLLMNPKFYRNFTGPEFGESKKYNKGSGYQQSPNKHIASDMRSRFIADIEDFLSKFNPVSIKGSGGSRPPISLNSGTNKRGLRHILERHHPDYFPGNKGDLFPNGTSIDEIIQAINDVYSNGSRVTKNPNDIMQSFNKVVTVNKETHLYKLVVDTKTGDIVTFFKQTQI